MLLNLLGAVVLIVILNYYFIILLAVLCVVFGFLRRVYLKTSKNVKRLEGISEYNRHDCVEVCLLIRFYF